MNELVKFATRRLVKDIDPQTSILDKEGEVLLDLASRTKSHSVCEIGSWLGRSTIWLAAGLAVSPARNNDLVKTVAVDPHKGQGLRKDTYNDFCKNIQEAGLATFVTPVKKTSIDFSKECSEAFEGVFIDADHTYEAVSKDFEVMEPLVVGNGWIAFHDTIGYPGVKRLVLEDIFLSKRWKVEKIRAQLVVARKKTKESLLTKTNNYFWFLYKWLIYDNCFWMAKWILPRSIKNMIK